LGATSGSGTGNGTGGADGGASGTAIAGDDSSTPGFGDGFGRADVSAAGSGMAIGTLTAPDCNGLQVPGQDRAGMRIERAGHPGPLPD